jgi:hypothetical protein
MPERRSSKNISRSHSVEQDTGIANAGLKPEEAEIYNLQIQAKEAEIK